MHVMGLKIIPGDLIFFADRAHIGQGDLGRFFHHIAHLSRHLELSVSRHHVDLDLQGISPYAGPGQAADNAHLVLLVGVLKGDLFLAQVFFQVGLGHSYRGLIPLQEFPGRLPADLSDPPLQIPDAGLSGIVVDDLFQGLIADGELSFIQSVPLQLLGHQVVPGNMEFFIFRIAGYLDHLHTVQKGTGDGLGGIGCGDKENAGKIQGDLHIVIPELHVLLSVQDLKKR